MLIYLSFFQRRGKFYIMNKLRQAELYARLRDLGNSLYDLNQPATHRYQLILCSKQTAKVRK